VPLKPKSPVRSSKQPLRFIFLLFKAPPPHSGYRSYRGPTLMTVGVIFDRFDDVCGMSAFASIRYQIAELQERAKRAMTRHRWTAP
jgi:hypothetical protein